MRKHLICLLTIVSCLSIFSACKDDDDDLERNRQQWAAEVAGTYEGNLTVKGSSESAMKQKLFVTKESNNNMKVELKDLTVTLEGNAVYVGDISVPNIPLCGNNGVITLGETAIIVEHASLGLLNIKVTGNLNGSKLVLNIEVSVDGNEQMLEITFNGKKLSDDVDMTDYAEEVVAWYARQELTITGIDMEATYPTDGVEIFRSGFNKIGIKSFYLSFPPRTRSVKVDTVELTKVKGGLLIDTVRQTLVDTKNGDAVLVLSGKFTNHILTLNMKLSTQTDTAVYVYTGEKKLTGATIEKMTIAGDAVAVQPDIEEGTGSKGITVYVKPGTTAEQLNLVPTIQIAEGAVITLNDEAYVSGTAVDFSKKAVFKVVAESGKTKTTYTVVVQEWNDFDFRSDLNQWETKHATAAAWQQYEEPANGWATSNEGVKYIKLFYGSVLYGQDKPYAVTVTDDAKSGKAARLETLHTGGNALVPKVTSGTVYCGTFKVVITNTLKSTRFGYPCLKQPKSFKGSYKYTPGSTYYTCLNPASDAGSVKEDQAKTDSPAINAVLYEVNNYAYEYLDGTNLLTSDKIVAIASVKDAGTQDSFKDFDVKFDFGKKQFDATKKYKLAIVCSSSKEGDKFSGAPGSVLIVDDLEIVF